jgi:hypothetical protein
VQISEHQFISFTTISLETTTHIFSDTDFFTLLPGGILTSFTTAIEFNAVITSQATVNIPGTIVSGANGVDAFNFIPALPDSMNNLRVRVGP